MQITTPESFMFAFDGPAFQSERIALARRLGLEKDPEAVKLIERRREEILVDQMFQDSVTNHVNATYKPICGK